MNSSSGFHTGRAAGSKLVRRESSDLLVSEQSLERRLGLLGLFARYKNDSNEEIKIKFES